MQNVIITTIILLLIINSYGFIYSYLITKKNYFLDKKIQSKNVGFDVLKSRMPLVLFNVMILIILSSVGLYFFKGYYIKDYISLPILILEIFVVLIIDDFFFYFLHRIMHENKYFYGRRARINA